MPGRPMPNDNTLHVAHGRHLLTGSKLRGRWRFACVSWPHLSEKFNGAAESGPCVAEFLRLCLVGGVVARRVKRGEK